MEVWKIATQNKDIIIRKAKDLKSLFNKLKYPDKKDKRPAIFKNQITDIAIKTDKGFVRILWS